MKKALKIILTTIAVLFLLWNFVSYANILCTNLDPDKHVAAWNLYELWFNAYNG